MQQKLNIAFVVMAIGLVVWATPALALVAGIIFALIFGAPFPLHAPRFSKTLLQVCVVLLGFGMNLQVVLRAGVDGSLFAVATIGATLWLGFWLGGRLALNSKTSALISAGTAICGGSAIAAVGSVIAVTEAEIAVAIGTVFLLNAAALYLFPIAGHVLHLSPGEFGLWAGVAVHDISSVVGAAMSYGAGSLETATAVKLSRTLWIAPLTLGMAIWFRRKMASTSSAKTKAKIAVPWFIGFFLLASLVRSCVPSMESLAPWISQTAREGMTLVLCLIGASISPGALRALGWRAVALGVSLWLFISIGSLLAIRLFKLSS